MKVRKTLITQWMTIYAPILPKKQKNSSKFLKNFKILNNQTLNIAEMFLDQPTFQNLTNDQTSAQNLPFSFFWVLLFHYQICYSLTAVKLNPSSLFYCRMLSVYKYALQIKRALPSQERPFYFNCVCQTMQSTQCLF